MSYTKLKSIIKYIISIWKPDFRKTTGWICISSGLVMIAPNFIQEIIMSVLRMHDFFSSAASFNNSRAIGGMLISIGVHYHLLYMASQSKQRELEVVCAISLLFLLPIMIYLAW